MAMASSWLSYLLSFIWPSKFSSNDDIAVSKRIVNSLPVPPSTRYFTLALRHPQDPQSVVYILSAVLLSEKSASDSRDLINAVKPNSVIVQVGSDALSAAEIEQGDDVLHKALGMYPTSPVHFIQESFHDSSSLDKYVKMAQADVLKAIFGTTLSGHVFAAKQAAKESKSLFYYLEAPGMPTETTETKDSHSDDIEIPSAKRAAALLGHMLFAVPPSKISSLCFDAPGLKYVSSHVMSSVNDSLAVVSGLVGSGVSRKLSTDGKEYECPPFAEYFYPLLNDMYEAYKYLPGLSLALESTQRLLKAVEDGKHVSTGDLSMSQCFRLAVEGLRVSLHSSAEVPLKTDKNKVSEIQFDDLPYEEKCEVLLAQALKQQAQNSKVVVAILDAGMVGGIRKHWETPVPDYVAAMARDCLVLDVDPDIHIEENELRKMRILEKPVIVVGAGAAAAVGVASFTHWAPVSTAVKVASFKIPLVIKLLMLQTKKGTVMALSKVVTPVTNFFFPFSKGLGTVKIVSGSNFSLSKAMYSTGKLRGVAHSIIATAEKASFSATRTAFYNAMRNRHRKVGKPWLSFGVSVAACIGLITYGDGIENVIEAIPEASSITKLCRGVSKLTQTSNSLKESENTHYWDTMYSRLYAQLSHKKA